MSDLPKKILLATDGSEDASLATRAATRTAASLEEAREADEVSTLIAVGSRGLRLTRRLRLGSDSTKVLGLPRVPCWSILTSCRAWSR